MPSYSILFYVMSATNGRRATILAILPGAGESEGQLEPGRLSLGGWLFTL